MLTIDDDFDQVDGRWAGEGYSLLRIDVVRIYIGIDQQGVTFT